MSMKTVLREKRKALGLTQEQIACALGVTTPAVNKWEKGTTCPDLALLPALARLLQTDPNTLLQFEVTLSQQEIWHFLNHTIESMRTENFSQGFALILKKTQEYPNCTELLHAAATTLDGALMMSVVPSEDCATYREAVLSLYERVAQSNDDTLASKAKYMLVSKHLAAGEITRAQETLDLLADWQGLDKRGLQADVWLKQGETQKAAEMLERKLLCSVQEQQATLFRLIRLAAQEGNAQAVKDLAHCCQKESEAFSLGAYWEQLGPLEAAVCQKDVTASLRALTALLEAVCKPNAFEISPLFSHIPHKDTPPTPTNSASALFLKPLLAALEQEDDQYAFLRGQPEFEALLAHYRGKCM